MSQFVYTMGDLGETLGFDAATQTNIEHSTGGYEYEVNALPRPVDYDLPDRDDMNMAGLGAIISPTADMGMAGIVSPTSDMGDMGDLFDQDALEAMAAASATVPGFSDSLKIVKEMAVPGIIQDFGTPGGPPTGVGVPPPPQPTTGDGLFGKTLETVKAAITPLPSTVDAGILVAPTTETIFSTIVNTLFVGDVFGVPKKLVAGAVVVGAGVFAVKRMKKRGRGRTRRRGRR